MNTVLFINYIKDTEVRRLVNPKSNIDAMGLNPAASGAAAAVFKYLGVLGSGGEDGAFRYLQVLGFNFRKLPSWACTTSLGFGLLRHPPPFPALIVTKAFAPLRPIFFTIRHFGDGGKNWKKCEQGGNVTKSVEKYRKMAKSGSTYTIL